MTNDDDFEPAPEPAEPAPEVRFEDAKPVTPKRRAPATPVTPDSEHHLLACCLLDEGQTLDRCIESALAPADFTAPGLALIYGALARMRSQAIPIGLDTLIPELGSRLEQAGGITGLMDLKTDSTARAEYHLQRVLSASARARFIRSTKALLERAERGEDLPELAPAGHTPVKARPITSYTYPSDDDPNMLLGSDDYLGRGGGLLFVSHAGAGKSSWAMDACMMWSLGRAWMQIKSHQARKVLIVQAEDSDRYIGKIFASFAHVNRLTPGETALLAKNCRIVRLKGVSGPRFFASLTALCAEHEPDLVVINPIYLYAEGDITRSEFAQPFLLGLDAVNRAEKWAYILIHHTGKPQAKGNNGKRAEVEDWESAYMGFGSSYLANWPRATILLEPVSGHPGRFQIKLGKGGFNAGVTKQVEQGAGTRQEPTTRISIRHSTARMQVGDRERPVYYWEIDTDAPVDEKARKGGKAKEFSLSMFTEFIPQSEDKAIFMPALYRYAREKADIGDTTFRDLIREGVQDGFMQRVVKGGSLAYWIKPAVQE